MAQQSCGDTDCDDGPWLRPHLYVSWVGHGCEPHYQCRFGLDGRPAGQHGQVHGLGLETTVTRSLH